MKKRRNAAADAGRGKTKVRPVDADAKTPSKEVSSISDCNAAAVAATPLAENSPFSLKKQQPASDSKCYSRRRRKVAEDLSDDSAPSTFPAFDHKRPRWDSYDIPENDDQPVKVRRKAAKIPKKFVEEQKKYFAEVDAFELQEAESEGSSEGE